MGWRGGMFESLVALAVCVQPLMLPAQTAATASPTGGPRIVIDSLYVEDGALRVDFHADSVVTVKLLEGLRRGLTAAITYHVHMWHKRWLSDMVAERHLEWKASFDNWERKYIVAGGGERRLTASVATVREKWTRHHGLRLAETSRLQSGRNYYVTIEALLEPVSKENLREIRGWLAGEVKGVSGSLSNADTSGVTTAKTDSTARATAAAADSTDEKPGFKLRFLETLMNLIGFGGKKITMRSEIFQVEENAIVWQP